MTNGHHDTTVRILAPAKINLFLSVTGKRDNGYHNLQSLIAFADFGDIITITPADEFSFKSTSKNLPTNENNLVISAAQLLANAVGKELNCNIHLEKNIPIGAGLGGGSSDAATTIKGLLEFWNMNESMPISPEELNTILLKLGADVLSCFHRQSCYFEGIGEIITPIQSTPTLDAVLIYPNKHCSTPNVFKEFKTNFSKEISLPSAFINKEDYINFIQSKENDLTLAAIQNIPEISDVLDTLKEEENCILAKMSGSGSACFGLFTNRNDAKNSVRALQKNNPNWWVKAVTL